MFSSVYVVHFLALDALDAAEDGVCLDGVEAAEDAPPRAGGRSYVEIPVTVL